MAGLNFSARLFLFASGNIRIFVVNDPYGADGQ